MKMSIEEAHTILSNGLVNAPSEHKWCLAFKIAIDVMGKYQKIQEIAEPLKGLSADEMSYVELRIREILDGNDDD